MICLLHALSSYFRDTTLAKGEGSQVATLCRPNSKKGKIVVKLAEIRAPKNVKRDFRPLGHRSVELGFDLCFQQSAMGGWGLWLKDISRGLRNLVIR
jgi:hypothetical protein